MGFLVAAILLTLPGSPAAVPAAAQSTSTVKGSSPAAQARREKRRDFDNQLRAEREAFQQQLRDERKAFRETLKGKPAEEKKTKLAEFTAAHQEKRKAFRKEQAARRRDFEGSLKRDSVVPR